MFSSGNIKPPIHDQISDLQRKLQLLEGDRSAYYETSQNNIKKNRETILHLREENKRLNRRLSHTLRGDEQMVREVFQSRSEKAAFRNMSGKEAVQVLDQKVCDKVKKLNALKHTTHTHQRHLQELRVQYSNLRGERINPHVQENNTSEVDTAELHPQKQNLRVLENRLEKAQLKCQEAEHIMQSYLKLKEQLQEESLMFQPQLDELEVEILRQKQELRDLQDMNSDAHLAKETAKAELQQQEEQVYGERREREMILNRYKKQAEERRAQAERGERRAQRVVLHADEVSVEAQHSSAVGQQIRVVSSSEEAFQLIRETTGVTSTQEVVDRFISQQDTQRHLEDMKVENETKLQQLKEDRDTLLTQFQDIKFSGDTKLTSAQQVLEEYQHHLQTEQQRRDAAKEKLEQLTHTHTTISTAVEHLTHKLQHTPPVECVQLECVDGVVQMLKQVEVKLQCLQEELQDKDLTILLKEMEEEEFHTTIEGKLPQFNTRITLPDNNKPDLYEDDDDSDDDDGDIITRAFIKRQSQLIIDSKTKRKTRLKKRKVKL